MVICVPRVKRGIAPLFLVFKLKNYYLGAYESETNIEEKTKPFT